MSGPATTTSVAPGPAGAAGPDEERVAVLTGDRLCLGCGYNLVGQMVLREPHYRLLIVRCPECGAVASVQEYPGLGPWAARWGAVLSALWLILLVGVTAGTAGALCGMSIETTDRATRAYGMHLRNLHAAAREAPPAPATPPRIRSGGGVTQQQLVMLATGTTQQDYVAWWKGQDPAALLADAGGWFGAIDWRALLTLIPASVGVFALGWFWAIALLSLPRRRVLAWGAVLLALGAAFIVIGTWEWFATPTERYWNGGRIELGLPLLALTLACLALPLAAGILAGRSLTRLLVRALLPPRLRGPLAGLWLAEGLTPPRPGGA